MVLLLSFTSVRWFTIWSLRWTWSRSAPSFALYSLRPTFPSSADTSWSDACLRYFSTFNLRYAALVQHFLTVLIQSKTAEQCYLSLVFTSSLLSQEANNQLMYSDFVEVRSIRIRNTTELRLVAHVWMQYADCHAVLQFLDWRDCDWHNSCRSFFHHRFNCTFV